MKTNGNGNCYEVAGRLILNAISDDVFLCHGDVVGMGKIEGIIHGHAWIEINNYVIDQSNKNNVYLSTQKYYKLARISGNKVKKYNRKKALLMMKKTMHFGPWY